MSHTTGDTLVRVPLGVVGLGENWERRHKPALLRLSDKFEVRAVCDEVAQRAAMQAADLGCDATDGFTSLVERDDIDAVYVLTNSWYGVEPVRAACRAGKAVYHAGSFGQDAARGDEVIAAVRASGVRFMTEFPWRFCPATVRLMELLASGLGSPQLVFCEHSVLVPETDGAAPARGEMSPTDVAVHLADWLRFVFSRNPTHLRSIGAEARGDAPCRGFETLLAEFGDAVLGEATIYRYGQSWPEAAAFRGPRFQVVAERGVAYLEMPTGITWFDKSGRHDESLDMERSLGELLADRFYRIVVHGSNPSPGLDDADWARRMVIEARRHPADRASARVDEPRHRTAG